MTPLERCLASSVVPRLRDYEGQVARPTLSALQHKTWGYVGSACARLPALRTFASAEPLLFVATVTVGNGPYGLVVSPDGQAVYVVTSDGKTVYVTNEASKTVSVI